MKNWLCCAGVVVRNERKFLHLLMEKHFWEKSCAVLSGCVCMLNSLFIFIFFAITRSKRRNWISSHFINNKWTNEIESQIVQSPSQNKKKKGHKQEKFAWSKTTVGGKTKIYRKVSLKLSTSEISLIQFVVVDEKSS